ncbi:hypothetical protein JZ751_004089 [Albula glossodonta]|uniref:Cadherin domain-containing protein n=1 Tax=Albula glossodonta TaxID=121402 RepID=A0A8T2P6A9_9TELE|nr:hypothetical protein JZ751_004089 [Albula glossodonta]
MARSLIFLIGVFYAVFSGYAGSCAKHSFQRKVLDQSLAGNHISKDYGVQSNRIPHGLIQDRPKLTVREDDYLSSKASERKVLRRTKRRWSPLPFNIIENDVPPFPKDVEVVGSDSSANYSVYYTISGPGVTSPPIGLFSVNRDTGMVRVHRAVDREEYPQFVFEAQVFDRRTNRETDLPLPITVMVNDVNDNAPQFSGSLEMWLLEKSSAGTTVGKLNATDKDQENTPHTKIQYKLLSGTDLFVINSQTGVITTKTATLDREVQDKHLVTVQIKDMDGAPNGLASTGTATILLKDINDNPPTFREKSYSAKVQENKADVLVLRIPVDDKDLKKTPNWNAVYKITKGNEKGNFRIETDPKTNEGLLYVSKALNHEEGGNLKLEVTAENEAKLVGSQAAWASIPVDINVIDEDEGPEFSAPILQLRIKENVPNGTLIGTYTAVDPETKSSEGIKYYKVSDPASWINVDENTGELTIANTVDRESQFVTGNMYNITVKAVDRSSKTGTGMVLIRIEDENDNAPSIPSKDLILCEKNGELGSVLVEAEDHDLHPFSGPFTFELADGHDGKWKLKDMKDTSVVLQQAQELPTGVYTVPLVVKDLQSFGEKQVVSIRICQCRAGQCIAKQSSVSLGVWGILALLLGLALLLLLCIFCTLACTTEQEKIYLDDASSGMLLKSNTEAPGEEVNAPIVVVPSSVVDGSVKMGHIERQEALNSSGFGTLNINQETLQKNSYPMYSRDFSMTDTLHRYNSGIYGGSTQFEGGQQQFTNEYSSLETWRTNGLYLDKKLTYFITEGDGRYADDLIRAYGYEGEGSPAGSVGCCSDQEADDNLDFLNTLGPKFKTLADVCAAK